MKKPLLLLMTFLFLAFTFTQQEPKERTATIKKYDGYYLYWDSKPTDDYEVIGMLDASGGASGAYEARRRYFIRKTQKKYAHADAIYYDPDITGKFRAFAIKFKD